MAKLFSTPVFSVTWSIRSHSNMLILIFFIETLIYFLFIFDTDKNCIYLRLYMYGTMPPVWVYIVIITANLMLSINRGKKQQQQKNT